MGGLEKTIGGKKETEITKIVEEKKKKKKKKNKIQPEKNSIDIVLGRKYTIFPTCGIVCKKKNLFIRFLFKQCGMFKTCD